MQGHIGSTPRRPKLIHDETSVEENVWASRGGSEREFGVPICSAEILDAALWSQTRVLKSLPPEGPLDWRRLSLAARPTWSWISVAATGSSFWASASGGLSSTTSRHRRQPCRHSLRDQAREPAWTEESPASPSSTPLNYSIAMWRPAAWPKFTAIILSPTMSHRKCTAGC